VKVLVAGKTDVGQVRQNNEDNFFTAEDGSVFLVADGMGGHASGEVASKIAVDVIREYFDGTKDGHHLQIGEYDEDFSDATNRIASAVRLANQAIYEASQGNPLFQGMGTTIAAVLISNRTLSIAHVGDSRVYLIRAGGIEQITDDHSLVSEQVKRDLITREQAKESEMKNVLTRALGINPEVEVDLDELVLLPGDMLVLCTDGLTNMVDDDDIRYVVISAGSPVLACDTLINMANANGGKDNVTAIVAKTAEKEGWLYSLFDFRKWFRR
jgi:serine/threonine protein phosphatase PrpC